MAKFDTDSCAIITFAAAATSAVWPFFQKIK